jgi:PAS domain S-box-containing protein
MREGWSMGESTSDVTAATRRTIPADELARLLLESTGDGIYGVDVAGNCTFANPACLRLLGYSSEEDLLGEQMHELIHHTRPDGSPYPVEECRIYQALRDLKGAHVDDEVMFRSDGSAFPAEYRSFPMIRDGGLVGSVVSFADITDRLREQAELRAADEQVRLLVQSTGEGIYEVDLEGRCTLINPAAVRILGFGSQDDLLGEQMHELVHHTRPDGSAYPIEECRIYEALRELKGTHVDDELMYRADGAAFPAEYRSHPMIRDGELLGSVVTFVDITERVRQQDELIEAHRRIGLLLESTGEGIYGIDTDGRCTFINPAAVKLLGYRSVDELMGKQMHELIHHTRPDGSPYPTQECRIYQALREKRGTHVDEEVLYRADGSIFPSEYWSYPMIEDDELVGCVVTFTDITTRVTRERLLVNERELSERLLLSILPESIAARLKTSPDVIADSSDEVTVLFADLAGFTAASADLPPEQVVSMLDGVFTAFDELVGRHGLEKIKTIGDGYMVAGGIPQALPDHAERVAALALGMVSTVHELAAVVDLGLDVRIGIASGPVVAGVIGKKKFTYDLWGDTVNTASRMEAYAPVGGIQVTEQTYQLLRDEYEFERRDEVPIKGKGVMTTYVLVRRKGDRSGEPPTDRAAPEPEPRLGA